MIRPGHNLEMLRSVAMRLGPLLEQVVFLGGAATELLVTDPGASAPRPTEDVDVVVHAASTIEYTVHLRAKLRALGFAEDTGEGAPICRWVVGGVKVDVMPTLPGVLGFSNHWYPSALARAKPFNLPGGPQIRLVTAPYFLATKIEAYKGRGGGDHRASHDIEDFIAVVDGRPSIEAEVAAAEDDVREYLAREIAKLLADTLFAESLAGHLPGDAASQGRLPALTARLERLARRP